MFNLQFDNIVNYSYPFIRDKLSNSNDISKRVILIACLAFSSLTALYLAFKYCCCSLNKKELFSVDEPVYGKFDFIPPKLPHEESKEFPYQSPLSSYSTTFKDNDITTQKYSYMDESNSDKPSYNSTYTTASFTQLESSPTQSDVHLNDENDEESLNQLSSPNLSFDISNYGLLDDDATLPKEFQVNPYPPPSSPKFKKERSPIPISPLNQEQFMKERDAIRGIKIHWLDTPQDEVKRILNTHLLPSSLQTGSSPQSMSTENLEKYMVMGRVLELKKYYKNTHYVFTHGQAPEISIVNEFLKTCIRIITPDQYHPYRPAFRLPNTITYFKNVNAFIKTYNATSPSFKDDGIHSHEIISVDAQFTNQAALESALYFFSKAHNIGYTASSGKLKNIFKLNFLNFLPVESICEELAIKAEQIAIKRKQETKVGVLYAICIPKSVVQNEETNIAYASHAFGVACTCAVNANRIKKLEEMQQDIVTTCNGGNTQYRILTPRLMEEKEARCFAVTPLSKIKKNDYKNQIEKVVTELKNYSHLYALIEELDDQYPNDVLLIQIESLKETIPFSSSKQKHIEALYAAANIAKTKAADDADIINKMNAEAAHLKT